MTTDATPETPAARAAQIVDELRAAGSEADRLGMARFGINADRALGVRIPVLRAAAKRVGRDHALAGALWRTAIHEVRILAGMVDEPDRVTRAQAERWVKAFDSWDLCDQTCMNLFDRVPFAWEAALEWSEREPEFTKRAGFALMAVLAWHDKTSPDAHFAPFLDAVEREAWDERVYVKKAVNWALRQIGKRSPGLRRRAIARAKRLERQGTKPARWIARDALRELERGTG